MCLSLEGSPTGPALPVPHDMAGAFSGNIFALDPLARLVVLLVLLFHGRLGSFVRCPLARCFFHIRILLPAAVVGLQIKDLGPAGKISNALGQLACALIWHPIHLLLLFDLVNLLTMKVSFKSSLVWPVQIIK